jgi:hypothetical protein
MSRDKRTEIQQFAIDIQDASQKASAIITEEMAKYVKEKHKYNSIIDFHKAHIKSRCELKAEFLVELGYRKIHDDHQRQCACYALGCQMAEELKREFAREIFAAVDSTIDLVCAMTGLDIAIFGKYAELKKKYTESEDTNVLTNTVKGEWKSPIWTAEMWKDYKDKYTEEGK